jgi:CDP-glycerol glycerophosphotransferase
LRTALSKSRALTALVAAVPKSDRKVVVHSLPDLEDGALAVLEGLHARGHDPILLLEDPDAAGHAERLVGRPVRAVHKNTARGRAHYLSARHVVTTHGVFSSHRPPRSQVVANIWHGEALSKPVGRWVGGDPTLSTWATALSTIGKAFRCAEFDLHPDQVLVVGAPRNDRMLRADRDAVRRAALGDGPGALFLWLPTYRAHRRGVRTDGEAYTGMVPLDDPAMDALDRWLVEHDAVLLAKPHPLSPKPEPGRYERIRAIDEAWLTERELTLYTLMAGIDCLVTDVSSVWIDFLLVDRPIVFAFPDLEAYRRSRGLHLEPYDAWVPGPLTRTGDELLQALAGVVAGGDPYAEARRDTTRRLHQHPDGGSTDRLLDRLGL